MNSESREWQATGSTDAAESKEKRRHPRASLSLLIQFHFSTLDEFLAEHSVDLSEGGIFIRTEAPREEGVLLYLQFALHGGGKLIEGLGRVVRVNQPGSMIPGMGIEFVNLDRDSTELISEIVQAKIARRRQLPED